MELYPSEAPWHRWSDMKQLLEHTWMMIKLPAEKNYLRHKKLIGFMTWLDCRWFFVPGEHPIFGSGLLSLWMFGKLSDCHRLPQIARSCGICKHRAEVSTKRTILHQCTEQRAETSETSAWKTWKETPRDEGASFGALDAMLCLSSPNRKNVTLGAVPTSCPCSQGCARSEVEYVGIWPGMTSLKGTPWCRQSRWLPALAMQHEWTTKQF